jgi:hypothetical protein
MELTLSVSEELNCAFKRTELNSAEKGSLAQRLSLEGHMQKQRFLGGQGNTHVQTIQTMRTNVNQSNS